MGGVTLPPEMARRVAQQRGQSAEDVDFIGRTQAAGIGMLRELAGNLIQQGGFVNNETLLNSISQVKANNPEKADLIKQKLPSQRAQQQIETQQVGGQQSASDGASAQITGAQSGGPTTLQNVLGQPLKVKLGQ